MVVLFPHLLRALPQGFVDGGGRLTSLNPHQDTVTLHNKILGKTQNRNILKFAKSKEAQENGFHLLKMVGSLFTGLSVKYVDNRWNE